MIFRLSSLGPSIFDEDSASSSNFSKCLDSDYYQAKFGAFIQTELNNYVYMYNDTCSTNLDLKDIVCVVKL